MAKFKAHEMGLTLTSKNWQGSRRSPFQEYCGKLGRTSMQSRSSRSCDSKGIIQSARFMKFVGANFKRHTGTIPRWDTPDFPQAPRVQDNDQRIIYTAMCMELWAHRTIDNHAASPIGLHIIEGIYGRDGDFSNGPNPYGNENNFDGRPGTT